MIERIAVAVAERLMVRLLEWAKSLGLYLKDKYEKNEKKAKQNLKEKNRIKESVEELNHARTKKERIDAMHDLLNNWRV